MISDAQHAHDDLHGELLGQGLEYAAGVSIPIVSLLRDR